MEFAHNNSLIHIKHRQLNSALIGESRFHHLGRKKRGKLKPPGVLGIVATLQLGAQLNSGTVGKYLSDSWERTLTYLHENGWVFKYGKYVGFILHPIDALETNISPSTLVLLSGGDFPAFTFGGTC